MTEDQFVTPVPCMTLEKRKGFELGSWGTLDLPKAVPLNNLMNLVISPMGLKTCFHWNSDIKMNQDIPLLKWDHCGLFS